MQEIHKYDLGVLSLAASELGAITWSHNLINQYPAGTFKLAESVDDAFVIAMSAGVLALATILRKRFKDKLQESPSSNS